MREQIAEQFRTWDMRECYVSCNRNTPCRYCLESDEKADTILALIPKPTVRVKCDECEGTGKLRTCVCCGDVKCEGEGIEQIDYQDGPCPSCTDGWNEHLIEWHVDIDMGAQLPDGTWATEPDSKVLTLADLIDPDVAWAYGVLSEDAKLHGDRQRDIRNNKGTLRIGEKV